MMTILQYTAIQALASAAALSILFFDKRGKSHKPLLALLAYLIFIQMGVLVVAATFKLDSLIIWLLIFTLSTQVGSILLARGNVSKMQQKPRWTLNYRLPHADVKPHIHLKNKGKAYEHRI